MNKKIIAYSIIFCCCIGLFAQKGDGISKEEKKVKANSKKLEVFYEKAMIDSILSLYSNNCYYAHEYMTRLENKDALKKKLKSDFKAGYKIIDLSFSPDDLKTYDDVVLEIGSLTIKYVDKISKATLTKKYNYNILWKESSDKKFRIRSEIWSPIENPCK